MSTTHRSDGRTIRWTNDTGDSLAVDALVAVGALVGILKNTTANAATGVLDIVGEHEAAATAAEVWNPGDNLYLNTTTAKLTASPVGTVPAGVATRAKAANAATGHVALNARHSAAGTVAVAADALAIPVTHRHVSKTIGADAEALTLADGFPGQRLTVTVPAAGAGGGTATLTPTTTSGWVSYDLAAAGDSVELEFVNATVGWVPTGLLAMGLAPREVLADALVIPPGGVCYKDLGGDAEALTLEDSFPGAMLFLDTRVAGGGTGTVTPDTFADGDTLAIAEATDHALLEFVDGDGWTLRHNNGCVVG